MKTKLLVSFIALATLLLPHALLAQSVEADFGAQRYPYRATVVVKSVDFETTQNIDLTLPANFKYVVERVQTVVRTAPSAVTTAPRVGLSVYNGTTATQFKGSVAAEADAEGEVDTVFSNLGVSENGYFYTEDVAASSTSGLCTENVTLNTPGSLSGVVSPLHPRKVVLTLVDNAGSNLAGTVTLVGTNAQGESITEVITVVAGTLSYTTSSAFATLTSGTHNFGATGQATVDTLNLGRSVQVALPHKNSRVFRALTAGVADTVAAQDVAEGTYALTDVPDGATEQEVYYRTVAVPRVITGNGTNALRIGVTGGTVTGSDVRDVIVTLLKY